MHVTYISIQHISLILFAADFYLHIYVAQMSIQVLRYGLDTSPINAKDLQHED